MTAVPGNERVHRAYRRMARSYDLQMGLFERLLFQGSRGWVVSQAHGRVLEIGVGTGLNLPYYAPDATVIGIDLSPEMLAHASRRAAVLGLLDRIELREGDAQALDLQDGTMDAVVSTFTFCTIPDPAAAAREAFRVLRPGGVFVLAEHGPSSRRWVLSAQRGLERATFRFDADHLTRDPIPYLRDAGFLLDTVSRAKAGISYRVRGHRPA